MSAKKVDEDSRYIVNKHHHGYSLICTFADIRFFFSNWHTMLNQQVCLIRFWKSFLPCMDRSGLEKELLLLNHFLPLRQFMAAKFQNVSYCCSEIPGIPKMDLQIRARILRNFQFPSPKIPWQGLNSS